MATTSKVLSRVSATTNTATVLYTTPTATTTVVTNIAVVNTGSASYNFTLALGGISLHTTTTIAANSTIYIDCKQVLVATNTITGGASNVAVKFHISGVEIA